MWKWSCPKTPDIIWEHHSWRSMNASLEAHEDGFKVPGRLVPPCTEEHEYWDDGKPCTVPKCNRKYIRDEPDVVV